VNTDQKAAMILMAGEMVIAMMIALVKTIPAVPVWEVLFFRYLFGLMLLWPSLYQQGLAGIRTSRFSLHLFRSVTGMLAMGSFFFLVTRVPLAEATLAKLTAPFFVPLISRWWLGKGIGLMTWLAILLGFVGVGFVLRPGTTQFEPVLLVGIGGALMMSLAKVSIASMKHTEPAIRVMFWFFFLSLLMTGIPTLIYWHPPDSREWLILFGVAMAGTYGQLLLTMAYQKGNPGYIAVFAYSSIIFAALTGWLFWNEVPIWTTVTGCCLIVGAGVINLKSSQ